MASKFSVLNHRWREFLERRGVSEGLLAMFTLLVYLRSLGMGFVYDDHAMVEGSADFGWKDIPALFSQDVIRDHASNFYRPLTLLWQFSVHRLAGSSAFYWHFSEVLLHLLCAVLVFRLASKLLGDRRFALLAAAAFALHPTHVEVVTWVSDSSDLLMAALLLSSALALLRWMETGSPGWWVATWLLASACCFTKETGIVVPVLLFALTLRTDSKVGRPAILLTIISIAFSVCAFLILRSQVLHGSAHPLSKAGTLQMWLTEPAALWFYFSHLLFPVRLGLFYSLQFVSDWQSRAFVLPILLLGAALLAAVWVYRRLPDRRLFWFCAVWGFVPLIAPLYLKLFPAFELVHDRYLYVPSIALGVAWAVILKKTWALASRQVAAGLTAATAVLIAAAAIQTVFYQGVWRSDITLFQRAVEFTPDNPRALVNLGVAKLQAGDYKYGITLLKRSLEIQPDNTFAIIDLGKAAWDQGDIATAEHYFRQAVALEGRPNWMVLLANAEYRLNNANLAAWAAGQALELNPAEPGAHMLLGALRLSNGDTANAIREFSAELEVNPNNSAAQRALQAAQMQRAQQPDR